MRPLVVIPTYNESENIERMLHRIRACLPGAGILVVDDGSPDGTAELVQGVGAQLSDVHLLARTAKAGLGSAYRAGFAWGMERGFDVFIEIDADFSHDPAALPSLVAPLENGYDVSIGSRYIEGGEIPNWAWHRHLLSRGGNMYASAVLGLGVADATAGYRAYSADILRRIDLERIRAEGYGFQIEMTYRARQSGARHHRGADQFRRPRGRRVEDVLVHCVRGARSRDVVGPRPVAAPAAPRSHEEGADHARDALGPAGAARQPPTRERAPPVPPTALGRADSAAPRIPCARHDGRRPARSHPRRRRRAQHR